MSSLSSEGGCRIYGKGGNSGRDSNMLRTPSIDPPRECRTVCLFIPALRCFSTSAFFAGPENSPEIYCERDFEREDVIDLITRCIARPRRETGDSWMEGDEGGVD